MNKKLIFLCFLPLIIQAMDVPVSKQLNSIRDYLIHKPQVIEGRTQRRTLDLSDLNLTSLDGLEYVPDIQTITRLNLSKNNLKTIPNDSFRFVPQLRVLDLSINTIEKIEPIGFNNLQQLQQLDLSNNQLTRLSIELSSLNSLKNLNLENNQIFSIQDNAFRDLTNLEILNLSGNDLLHLPLALFTPLKNLHFLDMTGNKRFKLLPRYKDAILKKLAENAEIEAD
jgi:Leucine-rich repeat (LRR) protein